MHAGYAMKNLFFNYGIELRKKYMHNRETAMNTQLLEERLTNAQHQVQLLEGRCQDSALIQAKADSYKAS